MFVHDQIQVQDGAMVCPSCDHAFVIKEGIPNMVRRPIFVEHCGYSLLLPLFSLRTHQLLAEHELR